MHTGKALTALLNLPLTIRQAPQARHPHQHMHTKQRSHSHVLKRREALEHAHRQRRDLVVGEMPAQAQAG